MAGDWIKVEHALPDKPEVHYIASVLKIDPDAVVGKLLRVWFWFDQHTTDGRAAGVTYALIDRIAGVTGFSEAMQFAGWISQQDTVLVMPNFDKHTSESAKKRGLSTKRQSRKRHAPVTLMSRSERDISVTREEKRREEKKKEEKEAAAVFQPARTTAEPEAEIPPPPPVEDPNKIPRGKDCTHTLNAFQKHLHRPALEIATEYQMRRYGGPDPSKDWYPVLLREVASVLEVSPDVGAAKDALLAAIRSPPHAALPRDASFTRIAVHSGVKRPAPARGGGGTEVSLGDLVREKIRKLEREEGKAVAS